ncbi:MAG: CPXCG motif-containing cysteine-rich protein [Planctomycetia bacterium]
MLARVERGVVHQFGRPRLCERRRACKTRKGPSTRDATRHGDLRRSHSGCQAEPVLYTLSGIAGAALGVDQAATPAEHKPTARDVDGFCDACNQEVFLPIDVSAGAHQDFVEECPVCGSPMVLRARIGSLPTSSTTRK